MKKGAVSLFIVLCVLSVISAQDTFSGKYVMANQAEYDTEKKWFEITRNEYQEIVVNGEKLDNCVAYYDEIGRELFFVIERAAQYNTLMKFKFIGTKKMEVYMLANNRWQKVPELYVIE